MVFGVTIAFVAWEKRQRHMGHGIICSRGQLGHRINQRAAEVKDQRCDSVHGSPAVTAALLFIAPLICRTIWRYTPVKISGERK